MYTLLLNILQTITASPSIVLLVLWLTLHFISTSQEARCNRVNTNNNTRSSSKSSSSFSPEYTYFLNDFLLQYSSNIQFLPPFDRQRHWSRPRKTFHGLCIPIVLKKPCVTSLIVWKSVIELIANMFTDIDLTFSSSFTALSCCVLRIRLCRPYSQIIQHNACGKSISYRRTWNWCRERETNACSSHVHDNV